MRSVQLAVGGRKPAPWERQAPAWALRVDPWKIRDFTKWKNCRPGLVLGAPGNRPGIALLHTMALTECHWLGGPRGK